MNNEEVGFIDSSKSFELGPFDVGVINNLRRQQGKEPFSIIHCVISRDLSIRSINTVVRAAVKKAQRHARN